MAQRDLTKFFREKRKTFNPTLKVDEEKENLLKEDDKEENLRSNISQPHWVNSLNLVKDYISQIKDKSFFIKKLIKKKKIN
jgi:deferrochelatase/peroxidase EfeB